MISFGIIADAATARWMPNDVPYLSSRESLPFLCGLDLHDDRTIIWTFWKPTTGTISDDSSSSANMLSNELNVGKLDI